MRPKGLLLFVVVLGIAGTVPAIASRPAAHVSKPPMFYRVATEMPLPGMVGIGAGPHVAAASCAPSPRTTSEANVADTNSNPMTQVIYFIPAGECDEKLDNGTIQNSMNSLNAFYTAQGLGPLILDKTSAGAIDIPFVIGQQSASSYQGVSPIQNELTARGFNQSNKRFIVFATVNWGGVCGQADWPGQYAAFFLNSDSACGVRDFGNGTLAGAGAAEVVVGHEIIHNEGAVGLAAIHGCQIGLLHQGHICTSGATVELGQLDPEWHDIMFPYVLPGVKLSQKTIDPGHDDYFQVGAVFNQFEVDLADSVFWAHP